jgi:hypothetical protein
MFLLEPWFILFTVTNPLFWIVFVIIELLAAAPLIPDKESESHPGLALFLIIMSVAFFGLFTDSGILQWLFNIKHLAILALGYIPIGAVWATFRWQMLLNKKRSFYDELLNKFTIGKDVSKSSFDEWIREPVNVGAKQAFKKLLMDNGFRRRNEVQIRPMAADYKPRITMWMSYWPWDIPAYVLGDLLRDIFTSVYNLFANWYDNMSAWSFKGVSEID